MTVEVEVSLGRPCPCTASPIQLLLAASQCRSPSEHGESSFRLLFTRRDMKRGVQRTGLAANEQTGGG